ncbi:MAG: glutaminyl-peptide cyclotransferase [Pyrinomonadaceae bacterium]
MRSIVFSAFMLVTACCGGASDTSQVSVNKAASNRPADSLPVASYEILNKFPHDSGAFTQGLAFHNGFLLESAGQYEDSSLRKVELKTGKVVMKHDVPEEFFAEGMTVLNDKVYQITWREHKAFVYDVSDFKLLREYQYPGDGWGLTNDGSHLIMSDGTHVIRFVDPETFQTVRTIVVKRENGLPLMSINELEYVKGEIWANIWHSESPQTLGRPNHIARIDPASGKLLGWIDLAGISPEDVERDSENTLNGIAYDAAGDRIFVTGKQWRNLYEIKLKDN